MAISSKEVIKLLKEWPVRVPGSEDCMMAREALMARLSGEYGVRVSDAGFYTLSTIVPFIASMASITLALVYVASLSTIAGGIGLIALGYYLYQLTIYKAAPFASFNATQLTANIVAAKGSGGRVIIIPLAIDQYRSSVLLKQYLKPLESFNLYIIIGAVAFAGLSIFTGAMILSVFSALGLILVLLIYFFMSQKDVTAKDEKLAAGISAVSRCWSQLEDETEIIVLVADAGSIGQIGYQTYLDQQHDRLKGRNVLVFSIDEHDGKPFRSRGFSCFHLDDETRSMTITDMSNALETLILETLKETDRAV